jgi:hypothetical protein
LVKVLGHKSKVLSAYIGFGVHWECNEVDFKIKVKATKKNIFLILDLLFVYYLLFYYFIIYKNK